MTPEEQKKFLDESRKMADLARGPVGTFPQPPLDPKIAKMIVPRKFPVTR